ncbi:MAG: hypothetical protein JRF33_25940 [Deltaproteobacteria bacterium]|nr:hypothetical protein [Deltaproteobacteria bacterium]
MIGDAFSNSFSSLLPLLILLGGIFVLFIGAALFVRYRLGAERRKEAARLKAAQTRGPRDVRVGELLLVMGRPFSVKTVLAVEAGRSPSLWCELSDEAGEGRLLMQKDGGRVLHLPASEDTGPDAKAEFPAELKQGESSYVLDSQFSVEAGWEVAFYFGPMDRILCLECRQGALLRWRGREVPYEGLEIRELEPDFTAPPK